MIPTGSTQDVSLLGGVTAVVRSPSGLKLMKMAGGVANSPASVLIVGETGSGKELVRALHQYSARNEKSWIEVNCAAMPEHLLESEPFGHEKAAFSRADNSGWVRFQ